MPTSGTLTLEFGEGVMATPFKRPVPVTIEEVPDDLEASDVQLLLTTEAPSGATAGSALRVATEAELAAPFGPVACEAALSAPALRARGH